MIDPDGEVWRENDGTFRLFIDGQQFAMKTFAHLGHFCGFNEDATGQQPGVVSSGTPIWQVRARNDSYGVCGFFRRGEFRKVGDIVEVWVWDRLS